MMNWLGLDELHQARYTYICIPKLPASLINAAIIESNPANMRGLST
jgi:hypothetical protein